MGCSFDSVGRVLNMWCAIWSNCGPMEVERYMSLRGSLAAGQRSCAPLSKKAAGPWRPSAASEALQEGCMCNAA